MIEKQVSNDVVTLIVKGNIVAALAQTLKEEIIALFKEDYAHYIIDLDHVKSIDSSGVGVLIATQNDLSNRNAKLSVINVSPPIYKMFKIMRLDKHFTVQPKN